MLFTEWNLGKGLLRRKCIILPYKILGDEESSFSYVEVETNYFEQIVSAGDSKTEFQNSGVFRTLLILTRIFLVCHTLCLRGG